MLKPRLLRIIEEVFESGWNHDPECDQAVRNKLIDFLREEDHLLLPFDEENLMLARNAIRFMDADRIYAKTTKSKEAYIHAKALLDHLMVLEASDWNHYELNFAISSVHFTETMEQSIELAEKARKSIVQFKLKKNTDMLEGYLALNMCARILNAKYFDKHHPIELLSEFKRGLNSLEYLADLNSDLELPLLITKIRWKIFNRDESDIFTLCEQLLPHYDERIGKMIRSEVDFYLEAGVFDLTG